MKTTHIKPFLVFLLFCAHMSIIAQSQTQTIRGTIVDKESQMALIGANLSIENTLPLLGTSTDIDGNFRFDQVI